MKVRRPAGRKSSSRQRTVDEHELHLLPRVIRAASVAPEEENIFGPVWKFIKDVEAGHTPEKTSLECVARYLRKALAHSSTGQEFDENIASLRGSLEIYRPDGRGIHVREKDRINQFKSCLDLTVCCMNDGVAEPSADHFKEVFATYDVDEKTIRTAFRKHHEMAFLLLSNLEIVRRDLHELASEEPLPPNDLTEAALELALRAGKKLKKSTGTK